MSLARLAAGIAMAVAILAVVAGGSRWPWTAAPDDVALLRLDWRARGERVEECRPPTEEEIAERPPHMRPREICEGKVLPYALRVLVDDRVAVADTVRGAGAHGDRPLYVAREIAFAPGLHDLRVEFEKIGPDERGTKAEAGAGEEDDEDDEKNDDGEDEERETEESAGEATPSMRLSGTFRLAPRQVLVVTYDPERRELVASADPVDR